MSNALPRIDHVMVIVGDRLDEAVERYRQLGFLLTPRGHHSVGTSNHLAIFGDDYFELLGHEPQNAARAAGAWGTIDGFAGLILKTPDADALAAELREKAIGITGDAPRRLARMVELPNGMVREARFSSIHLDPALTPAGLILICQHHTPELVWRPEFQTHPNGATGIAGIAISSRDPGRSIELLARIHDGVAPQPIDGGLRLPAREAWIDFLTPDAAAGRFGDDIARAPDGADRYVALEFKTSSLAATARAMRKAGGVIVGGPGGRILIPSSDAFGVALTFE